MFFAYENICISFPLEPKKLTNNNLNKYWYRIIMFFRLCNKNIKNNCNKKMYRTCQLGFSNWYQITC